MEKFSTYLNYIAATILALVIFLALYIVFDQINSDKPSTKIVTIKINDLNNTPATEKDKLKVNELKKVLNEIQEVSSDIRKSQAEIIAEKNESFFDKIYTAIIAIVIAIAGFFGFKSVSDIKERAIKDAKDQAEDIAKSEFNNVFTTEYKAGITKEVTEILMSTIVKNQIEALEKRIFALEQGSPLVTKNDSNNPKNPFEN